MIDDLAELVSTVGSAKAASKTSSKAFSEASSKLRRELNKARKVENAVSEGTRLTSKAARQFIRRECGAFRGPKRVAKPVDLERLLREHGVPSSLTKEQRAACDAVDLKMKLEPSKQLPAKQLKALHYKLKPQDLDLRGTGKTYKEALDIAFQRIGMPKEKFKVTKWARRLDGKSIPVEYKGPNGSYVDIDLAHYGISKDGTWVSGPDAPHLGWQYGTKCKTVGHIILDSVPTGREYV